MEKNPGGNPNLLHHVTGSIPPSYKELGIEKTQAMRWQLEAEMSEEVFERFTAETKAKERRLPVEEHPKAKNCSECRAVGAPWTK